MLADKADTGYSAIAVATEEQLSRDLPLRQAQILGAHNAYNSTGDPLLMNQQLGLSRLLDLGIRSLDLDIHSHGFMGFTYDVCHGTKWDCSWNPAGKRNLNDVLVEIRDWVDGHPESLIFLDVEHELWSWHTDDVRWEFDSYLGKFSWRPDSSRDMKAVVDVIPGRITGPRVVVRSFYPTDGNDDMDAMLWNERTWIQRDISFETHKFDRANCSYNLDGLILQMPFSGVFRASPGTLEFVIHGFVDDKVYPHKSAKGVLDAERIRDLLACGATFVNADHWNEAMRAAAHWTWEADVRASDEQRAAALRVSSQRWTALPIERCARFACRNGSNRIDWQVTSGIGEWGNGRDMCEEEFPGYMFDVPRTFYENTLVHRASAGKLQSPLEVIWVDHPLTQ